MLCIIGGALLVVLTNADRSHHNVDRDSIDHAYKEDYDYDYDFGQRVADAYSKYNTENSFSQEELSGDADYSSTDAFDDLDFLLIKEQFETAAADDTIQVWNTPLPHDQVWNTPLPHDQVWNTPLPHDRFDRREEPGQPRKQERRAGSKHPKTQELSKADNICNREKEITSLTRISQYFFDNYVCLTNDDTQLPSLADFCRDFANTASNSIATMLNRFTILIINETEIWELQKFLNEHFKEFSSQIPPNAAEPVHYFERKLPLNFIQCTTEADTSSTSETKENKWKGGILFQKFMRFKTIVEQHGVSRDSYVQKLYECCFDTVDPDALIDEINDSCI